MKGSHALGGLLLLAALPLHGPLLPTGLGPFARAQERRRIAAREARRRPPPEGVGGGFNLGDSIRGPSGDRLGWMFGVRFHAGDHRSFTVAGDCTEEAITSAFEVDGAWVFLTEYGRALVSETFLGPLRVVAGAVCDHRAPAYGRGLAVQFVGDRPYAIDPRRGRVPLDAPPRTDEALFCDRLVGAAITREGALFRTDDGGARWRPVDLGGTPTRRDVAVSLECAQAVEAASPPELRVRTSHGWMHFAAGAPDARHPTLSPSTEPQGTSGDVEDPGRVRRQRYEVLAAGERPRCAGPDAPWAPPPVALRVASRGRPVRAPLFTGSGWTHSLRASDGALLARSSRAPGSYWDTLASLRWRGHDAQGEFRGTADISTAVHPPDLLDVTGVGVGQRALAVSRDGVLVGTTWDSILWARGRRAVDLSPFDTHLLWHLGTHLDDGRMLLVGLERSVADHGGTWTHDRAGRHRAVVARVDAEGAMAARAWSVHDADAQILGPAELGADFGLAVVDRGRVARFLPMDGDDAVGLGSLPVEGARVVPCATPAGSAPRLHSFSTRRESSDRVTPPIVIRSAIAGSVAFEASHAVYELRDGALCLRTLDARLPGTEDSTYDEMAPARFEAHDGRLDGVLDDGETVTPLRLVDDPRDEGRGEGRE